jgi:hypothetical protein
MRKGRMDRGWEMVYAGAEAPEKLRAKTDSIRDFKEGRWYS